MFRQLARIEQFLQNHPPKNIYPPSPLPRVRFTNNTILIVCDQMIPFHFIPEPILDQMPGIRAFQQLGIQFDNIYNNRQDCSPSRGSFASSQLNINISDNIDQLWQYKYVPQLDTHIDTIGKSMKRHGRETVWYGKNHFVSNMATNVQTVPSFDTNTRGCLKEYGYDIYNTFGDTYYYNNAGMFADNMIFNMKVSDQNRQVDLTNSCGKFIGAYAYLTSRTARDDRAYHLEMHLSNPHDTQHFWQNLAQIPTKTQLQFGMPFLDEQVAWLRTQYPDQSPPIIDPFHYSTQFPDATIQNANLTRNYFEPTFEEYRTNPDSLPFLESYRDDYVTDPNSHNSQFPFYVGVSTNLEGNATMPFGQQDIMSWKNLINNYYGLLLEADNYIYQIYRLLKNTNRLDTVSVIIMADHGDMMSSHGLKQKGFPFEGSCHVPCLIYSPKIPARLRGTKSNVLGSLLDIAPTIECLSAVPSADRSTQFLGKSLLQEVVGGSKLVPRTDDEPVFNIYNMWLTSFTYFNYVSWFKSHLDDNTVLPDFRPANYVSYQSFFTMYVGGAYDADGRWHQYKLARYFNFIELLLYNWMFQPRLAEWSVTAGMILAQFSQTLEALPLFQDDLTHARALVEEFFHEQEWNFQAFYQFILTKTGITDNVLQSILLIPLVNLTNSRLQGSGGDSDVFSYKMPGYYNSDYTTYNSFEDYYHDPNHNYYFFMYDLTDDPNELTNLLDQGFPERQTTEVLELASTLNDALNGLMDKYDIVYFDFIVPEPLFVSYSVNLKLNGGEITVDNASQFTKCFGINKFDGDVRTQPYYTEVLEILSNIG